MDVYTCELEKNDNHLATKIAFIGYLEVVMLNSNQTFQVHKILLTFLTY